MQKTEKVPEHSPLEEDVGREEEDRSEIEAKVEIWEDEENMEEDEEDFEGVFLGGKPESAIPVRYESDSDESITFPSHVIVEGYCWTESLRPWRVTAY